MRSPLTIAFVVPSSATANSSETANAPQPSCRASSRWQPAGRGQAGPSGWPQVCLDWGWEPGGFNSGSGLRPQPPNPGQQSKHPASALGPNPTRPTRKAQRPIADLVPARAAALPPQEQPATASMAQSTEPQPASRRRAPNPALLNQQALIKQTRLIQVPSKC